MVIVDLLTKYGHFTPMASGFTSQSIALAFVWDIVRLHGKLCSIVSDSDRVFLTTFWKELFLLQGTSLAMSSAYHPQTDGQTEALNGCLKMYLCCFVVDEPHRWVHFLPWAEFWYNTLYHTSTGMTPFFVVYGREPPTILCYILS